MAQRKRTTARRELPNKVHSGTDRAKVPRKLAREGLSPLSHSYGLRNVSATDSLAPRLRIAASAAMSKHPVATPQACEEVGNDIGVVKENKDARRPGESASTARPGEDRGKRPQSH